MIELSQLTKRYRTGEIETTALDQIDLQIENGEYVAITGPSGCGTSTLLGLLGLLDAPTSGSYRLQGEEVVGRSARELAAIRRGRISFVFQSFNLIDEMTVRDNVQLALRYGELSDKAQRQRVTEVLARLELTHRADHHPHESARDHRPKHAAWNLHRRTERGRDVAHRLRIEPVYKDDERAHRRDHQLVAADGLLVDELADVEGGRRRHRVGHC